MNAPDPTRHLVAILARIELELPKPPRFCDCGCWLVGTETCPACAVKGVAA